MTTQFAEQIDPDVYQNPSAYGRFFAKNERDEIDDLRLREHPPLQDPFRSCDTNLFLGFFFDGTRNNYGLSEEAGNHTHSNVARLFDAYQGQSIAPRAVMIHEAAQWPQAEQKYPHFFRIYAPGVGTPFDEIGDSGTGLHRTRGSAFGWQGQGRLVWMLAQAMNAVHRYIHKHPMLDSTQIRELNARIDLDGDQLERTPLFHYSPYRGVPANTQAHLLEQIRSLHRALGPHMPDPRTGKVRNINPGVIRNIHVSIFGFSRGAAAARAFANWLQVLCGLDARERGVAGLTLGGFAVHFDFMGLFDTVASVGTAALHPQAHGHQAWADSQRTLRVPAGVKCLHLVSAHEQRRSFPLDSISVGGQLPAGCTEIVFPGVHSDLGGGYAPGEQGRGMHPLGSDLLSRIPLALMYRTARLSGVPLKLELTRPFVQDRFRVDPALISAFNDYVRASTAFKWPAAPAVEGGSSAGDLPRLQGELDRARAAREQAQREADRVDAHFRAVGQGWGWDAANRTRRITAAQTALNAARATEEAAQSKVEAARRRQWRTERAAVRARPRTEANRAPLRTLMRHHLQLAVVWRRQWAGRLRDMPSVQRASAVDRNDLLGADAEFVEEIRAFERWLDSPPVRSVRVRELFVTTEMVIENYPGIDPERFDEWRDLEGIWHAGGVPAAVDRLLQDYVHDSRAGFKITGREASEVEPWLRDEVARYQLVRQLMAVPGTHLGYPRTPEEIRWIEHYMHTGEVPEMPTPGREFFTLGAGYLRFRRVYAGASDVRLTEKIPDPHTQSRTEVA